MLLGKNKSSHAALTRGQKLTVSAAGIVSAKIDKGTKVQVKLKLGAAQVYKKTWDFCEEAKKVGASCPVEKQVPMVTKTFNVPKNIPHVSCCPQPHFLSRAVLFRGVNGRI